MTDKFTHIPAAYEIVSLEYIDEIKSQAALLRHRKTGARIAVLANDDENKTFNIGFRTPPKDSTGVAHIMEHSVLCGSEKFPAKDPFVELAKGSLNTFLNAMTYPDKTVYPIASCNDTDFHIDKYLGGSGVLYKGFEQEITDYHIEGDIVPHDRFLTRQIEAEKAVGSFCERNLGMHELDARAEASRCLRCDRR